ncbi:MAG TPA: dipeptidase [Verrucomicrobiota bacterium]|nr:dipeptidase [Verrucomicrobiales bacterium]HRI11553.1 dipeptidase [Verrucomicrobiota bacterium]
MPLSAALDFLKQHDARYVRELCDYARIPSVSAQSQHAGDLRRSAEWIAERSREVGLDTVVHTTSGNPIVVAKTPRTDPAKPTFLVYGHYDVQPPEPFELWKSPPFEPRIEGRNVFARGISDNKGQHLAHLNAVEAWLSTGSDLPCNLTFLIEGEEEVGSKALYEFLPQHAKELACDAVVISDNGIPSLRHPALTYALRGIAAMEVRVDGPNRDLHSGIFGGSVDNPALVLCQLLAKLRDSKGRISIPGYYDDVQKLSTYERKQMAKLPFQSEKYRKFLGVPKLFGEVGFTPEEQRTARPTFEINGLTSGYQGEGSKTIIPSWATAKLTLRLVPHQKPAKVIAAVKKHLQNLCPPTVKLTLIGGHGGEPYRVEPTGVLAQAALRALRAGFGYEAVLAREGGSIPIVSAFRQHLKADTLLLGMALPDDNPHSPNEKFSLDAYALGMRMSAHLWAELAAASPGK